MQVEMQLTPVCWRFISLMWLRLSLSLPRKWQEWSKVKLGEADFGKDYRRVYSVLRRRIMKGQLPPSAKIKELDVAAELGVSRTPVRTALQRLIADGLLQGSRKRGAVTISWIDRDVAEIFADRAGGHWDGTCGPALQPRGAGRVDTIDRRNGISLARSTAGLFCEIAGGELELPVSGEDDGGLNAMAPAHAGISDLRRAY